jgi:outer membrane immunogenic protein
MRASSSLGLLAIAGLIAGTPFGVAHSADMPLKAPPPPPPPVATWTSCYVGVEAGYGWGRIHDDVAYLPSAPAFGVPNYTSTGSYGGAMGGPQVGCDYQWGSAWVVGVIATYDFADIAGSVADVPTPGAGVFNTHIFHEEIDGFGTVRGRIGWLVTPSWLIYGSGGLAYGRIVTSATDKDVAGGAQFFDPGEATWKTGWTAGGGVEWKFADHISVFAEYLYAQLADVHGIGEIAGAFPAFGVTDDYGRPKINVVKAGINWRFP